MSDSASEMTRESSSWQPKILALLCNWCSYAGADLAGSSRLRYPATIRVVRVPCSGRMDPMLILKGFEKGMDGVLVAGCHPGDCHYAKGNFHARRRITLLKRFLDHLGVHPDRFRFEWISAAESHKLQHVVGEMTEKITALGPKESKERPPAHRTGFPFSRE